MNGDEFSTPVGVGDVSVRFFAEYCFTTELKFPVQTDRGIVFTEGWKDIDRW